MRRASNLALQLFFDIGDALNWQQNVRLYRRDLKDGPIG